MQVKYFQQHSRSATVIAALREKVKLALGGDIPHCQGVLEMILIGIDKPLTPESDGNKKAKKKKKK